MLKKKINMKINSNYLKENIKRDFQKIIQSRPIPALYLKWHYFTTVKLHSSGFKGTNNFLML